MLPILCICICICICICFCICFLIFTWICTSCQWKQRRLMLPDMPILSCSAILIQNKSTKLQFCSTTGILLRLCGHALFVTKYCSCLRKGKQRVVSQKKGRKEGRKEGVSAKQLQDPLQTHSSMYTVNCTVCNVQYIVRQTKPSQSKPNQIMEEVLWSVKDTIFHVHLIKTNQSKPNPDAPIQFRQLMLLVCTKQAQCNCTHLSRRPSLFVHLHSAYTKKWYASMGG